MNYIHLSLGRSQTSLYAEPGKNSFKFGSIRLNLGISISRGRSVLTYVPIQIYRSRVDPYSLMYLYKYTGQGQIRTHLCTCTNIQVRGRSALTYVPIQIYRSRVDPYSLMYLYKYTGQGYSCTHVCTCTNIQVKGRSVLTYVLVQFLYNYTGQGWIRTHLCTCKFLYN